MYDEQWPIWTYQEQLPPREIHVGRREPPRPRRSIRWLSGGCIMSGARVRDSLLFSNVRVHEQSEVRPLRRAAARRDREQLLLRDAIVDEGAVIPDGTTIGVDPEAEPSGIFRHCQLASCWSRAACLPRSGAGRTRFLDEQRARRAARGGFASSDVGCPAAQGERDNRSRGVAVRRLAAGRRVQRLADAADRTRPIRMARRIASAPRMPDSRACSTPRISARFASCRAASTSLRLEWCETDTYGSFASAARPEHWQAFAGFVRRERRRLFSYGLFELLSERFAGAPWWDWPAPFSQSEPSGPARIARGRQERVSRDRFRAVSV